jgi:hypothetical protein
MKTLRVFPSLKATPCLESTTPAKFLVSNNKTSLNRELDSDITLRDLRATEWRTTPALALKVRWLNSHDLNVEEGTSDEKRKNIHSGLLSRSGHWRIRVEVLVADPWENGCATATVAQYGSDNPGNKAVTQSQSGA